MAWTREQELAINHRGSNILVSAGAGAGKTGVMVERIRRLTIDEDVDVERLLVVTFTNAAASEMKEKIRIALNSTLSDCYAQKKVGQVDEKLGERIQFIKIQLSKLSRAQISTFHSFATKVIKEFYYLIGIEPSLAICDESQSKIFKAQAFELTLEEAFEEGRASFFDFLDAYSSGRDFRSVEEMVLLGYETLMTYQKPWQWLESQLSLYENKNLTSTPEFENPLKKEAKTRLKKANNFLTESLRLLDKDANKVQWQYISELLAEVDEALSHVEDGFEGLYMAIHGITLGSRFPSAGKKNINDYELMKEFYDKGKEVIVDLRERLFSDDVDRCLELLWISGNYGREYARLLKAFGENYRQIKSEARTMDMSDIEQYCYEILTHEDAAKHYRDRFLHICIDEYQDTSYIQEAIISKIERGNNLFMVGDVKQSIYSFRLAEPGIFQDKYRLYKEEPDKGLAIDLNKNFRSKSYILDSVNDIFIDFMEGYDEDAMLYTGWEKEESEFSPKLHIIHQGEDDEDQKDIEANLDVKAALDAASDLDLGEELDEEELSAIEIEATYCAKLIKESIGRPYFDNRSGKEKRLELRDIVILLRAVKGRGTKFARILEDHGISTFIDDSESYFDTIEIRTMLNLLKVIDNGSKDYPLLAIMMSSIFGFTSRELAIIRSYLPYGRFAMCLDRFAQADPEEVKKILDDKKASQSLEEIIEVQKKITYLKECISRWQDMGRRMPLGRFIWEVMVESGYYIKVGTMKKGEQRQANLRALVDFGVKYSKNEGASLYGFVGYISSIKEKNVNLSQVKLVGEGDQLVRIMTIHKSKGLDFPMVIVAGLGGKLRKGTGNKNIAFDYHIGMALRSVIPSEHWEKATIHQSLIQMAQEQKEMEESKRVLYVALTRAKAFMEMTGYYKGDIDKLKKSPDEISNYLSMMKPYSDTRILRAKDVASLAEGEGVELTYTADFEGILSEQERKEIKERIDFDYESLHPDRVKSKYSVTELNARIKSQKWDIDRIEKDLLEEIGADKLKEIGINDTLDRHPWEVQGDVAIRMPKFLGDTQEIKPWQVGTAYHELLSRISFERGDSEGMDYLEDVLRDLTARDIISIEVGRKMDLDKVLGFVKSPLGQIAKKGEKEGSLFKEKSFVMETFVEGEKTLVQGVLDAFVITKDSIIMWDYKSNYIDKNKILEEENRIANMYKGQLELYKKALEEAYGKKVERAFLYLLDIDKALEVEI